jgi:hypothetical protein
MDGLADTLKASGWQRVYPYPPKAISVPCVIVDYPTTIDFDLVYQRGADRFVVVVRFVLGRGETYATWNAIGEVMLGPTALPVIDGSYDWGQVRVMRSRVESLRVGLVDYAQARFEVEVVA